MILNHNHLCVSTKIYDSGIIQLINQPTNQPTYLLHGAEAFLRSLTVPQLVKKFPAFHGTRRFITCSQEPATCPYPEPFHPISLRSISILPSQLHLSLQSNLLPSGFPTKICMHLSSTPYVPHAPHPPSHYT
jgi:hypothetical protein